MAGNETSICSSRPIAAAATAASVELDSPKQKSQEKTNQERSSGDVSENKTPCMARSAKNSPSSSSTLRRSTNLRHSTGRRKYLTLQTFRRGSSFEGGPRPQSLDQMGAFWARQDWFLCTHLLGRSICAVKIWRLTSNFDVECQNFTGFKF